jgi:hypothetical protein
MLCFLNTWKLRPPGRIVMKSFVFDCPMQRGKQCWEFPFDPLHIEGKGRGCGVGESR